MLLFTAHTYDPLVRATDVRRMSSSSAWEPQWWPCTSTHSHPGRLPETSLEHCVNLAPAGTGSNALFVSLLLLRHLMRGHAATKVPGDPTYVTTSREIKDDGGGLHHDHFKTVQNLRRNYSCFFITVRDPVERIESGFRYEMLQKRVHHSRTGWHPLSQFHGIDAWLSALRNESDPHHRRAHDMVGYSQRKVNSNSPGSHFLMPQLAYLHGLACARGHQLHVVCTNSLLDDLDALALRFGGEAVLHGMQAERRGQGTSRQENRRGSEANAMELELSTLKRVDDRTFIRENLFPEDTRWHALACGRDSQ